MYKTFGNNQVFGRTAVQQVTGLGTTRASALLKTLLEMEVIKPVSGQGKGKYEYNR